MDLQVRKKPDYIIGIDPDTVKSGVALLNTKTREIETRNCDIVELMRYVDEMMLFCEMNDSSLEIVVEYDEKENSNWHLKKGMKPEVAAATGLKVGRCKQIAKDIIDILGQRLGAEVIAKKPLRKCWKGTNGKITQEELNRFEYFRYSKKRTNPEERDAILLAIDRSRIPIRMYSEKKER